MGFIFMIATLGVPFYFIWNQLAPIYFSQLPALYQHLPFWHCMGLFALLAIARAVLLPFPQHFHRWKHHHHWKNQCN